MDLVLLVDFLLPVTLKDSWRSVSSTRDSTTEGSAGTEKSTGLGSGV
jgi:hypothetical protein